MLFGTSGIRGKYGTEITPQLAMEIANAFARKGERIAVARDLRETSEILMDAAISGILAKGAEAVVLGAVPTPTLALYTQQNKCKGIMITASHNPAEYNGLKLYRNGREISKKEEEEVEAAYAEGMKLSKWDECGKISHYKDAIADHIAMIERNVNVARIQEMKFKVVVDTNGVATTMAPQLLRKLGCEVFEINKVERGFVRPSEPNDANLSKLKTEVKIRNAHLGIGYDGDGDRAIIIDDKGEMIGLDKQLAMAIEHELRRKKGAVISTVEASLMIREVVERNNGKNIITGVGSTKVSELIEKNPDAIFGGEPAGEYIYREGVNTPDGMLMSAKFLEIASEGRLSEMKKKYPTYPILREKFPCADKRKFMKKIAKSMKLGGKRNTIDGIREDFSDGFVLVRPSGTEPIIRLTAEFKTQARLEEMTARVRKLIKEAL